MAPRGRRQPLRYAYRPDKGAPVSARSSVGRRYPICQASGCRQPAAATLTEVIVPATVGLELELRLCPEHRNEVERSLRVAEEAIFEAGLEAADAAIRAGWTGIAS
jgi:hypothetical protein